MKPKQAVRMFRRAGVEIDRKRGKGGHYLLSYGNRKATLPVHGDADLGPNLLRAICKQLGLKYEDVF